LLLSFQLERCSSRHWSYMLMTLGVNRSFHCSIFLVSLRYSC